jgi:hypothetical protein
MSPSPEPHRPFTSICRPIMRATPLLFLGAGIGLFPALRKTSPSTLPFKLLRAFAINLHHRRAAASAKRRRSQEDKRARLKPAGVHLVLCAFANAIDNGWSVLQLRSRIHQPAAIDLLFSFTDYTRLLAVISCRAGRQGCSPVSSVYSVCFLPFLSFRSPPCLAPDIQTQTSTCCC